MKRTKVRAGGRVTWTIQPDDDVKFAVEHKLGPNPTRGERTRLINQALAKELPGAIRDYHERRLRERLAGPAVRSVGKRAQPLTRTTPS